MAALKQFPEFNSSLSPEKDSLILKKYYNIGVAVDTPDGLVVPVVKEADRKGIHEISQDLGTISKKARDGKLGAADMQGATFTISSLGGIGGTAFTPIVNAPEVAILGVVRSKMAPVWDGMEFKPRLMLPVSLSYDHRVIDGALRPASPASCAARSRTCAGWCCDPLPKREDEVQGDKSWKAGKATRNKINEDTTMCEKDRPARPHHLFDSLRRFGGVGKGD